MAYRATSIDPAFRGHVALRFFGVVCVALNPTVA
jgi:hypothetical protein